MRRPAAATFRVADSIFYRLVCGGERGRMRWQCRRESATKTAPAAADTRVPTGSDRGAGVRCRDRHRHRPGPGRTPPRVELRDRVGARRLPRTCTRCSTRRRGGGCRSRSSWRRTDGGGDRDAVLGRPGRTSETGSATRSRSGCGRARDCSARCPRRWTCRSRAAARARRFASREMLLFPGLRHGEKLARRTSLAAARDPARQRRHAAGAGPRQDLADSRGRSEIVGELGPIPAAEAAQIRDGGIPRERQGRARRPRAHLPDPAGGDARRQAARRQARAGARRAGRRSHRHDDDQSRDRAGGDRRAGRSVRRDRRDGSAHRRPAGAERRRVLGRPAARIDDEDHHLDRLPSRRGS